MGGTRFGDPAEHVISIINAKIDEDQTNDDIRTISFGISKPLVNLVSGKVEEISYHRKIEEKVIYEGVDIFNDDPIEVIMRLSNGNNLIYERNGFLVFF